MGTSPNFPASYPNGLHERKTIEVAKGNVIKIHFTDFELERPDEVDYVDLTDGDGSFLGRFGARHYVDEEGSGEGSGDEGPGEMIRISDITSNTETVHVLFHTDSSVTRSGWRLEWSSSPSPPMEERELATRGVLTSPNFPERYLDRLDIVKKIQVPEGNTIRIRFTDFDCERKYDTVTITDKDGTRLGLFDGGRTLKMTGGLRRWSATRTRWKFCSTLIQVVPARVGGSTGEWLEMKRASQRVEF